LELFEDTSALKGPPKATLAKRAKSYSNFYDAAVQYLGRDVEKLGPFDALEDAESIEIDAYFEKTFEGCEDELLDASQQEYQYGLHCKMFLHIQANSRNRLYKNQLALSERHLDSLLDDTSSALDLLASLSESFKLVESQTTAFQAQCEDLLAEQKKLRDLADEIGTDLQYYAYLEPLTRRLNTPGSGRLARNDDFLDMLRNLNTCIDFMDQHVRLVSFSFSSLLRISFQMAYKVISILCH
jgi:conserved oligomeric Golgi complex subunit 3